ncbi:hypothetical protein K469DRAFT_701809, partial [Zopfia rhizophila CBS 207.26]
MGQVGEDLVRVTGIKGLPPPLKSVSRPQQGSSANGTSTFAVSTLKNGVRSPKTRFV